MTDRTSFETVQQIKAVLAEGVSVAAAAERVGVHRCTVHRVKHRGDLAAESFAHIPKRIGKDTSLSGVPAWIVKAGLASDFRDLSRELGEDIALRKCRELTADLRKFNAVAFR